MTKEMYLEFLASWQEIVTVLVYITVGLGVANYIFYQLIFATKGSNKEKFDLASKRQSKVLLTTQIFFAVGLFLFVNTLEYETMQLDGRWFFIRFFVAFCIGVLHGYISHLVLKFYYPRKLEGKLKKLRYATRINPNNGKKMKLLSEEEEDAYLDEGMQAEEDVFSVDYDVWIDESTGYTQIEKYQGHLSALECDRCGFQTLRLSKEEIITPATSTKDGQLLKEYRCSYCNRIKRKNVVLSHKIKDNAEDRKLIEDPLSQQDKDISVIKIEIHGTHGEIKEYDFPNLEHAKHFLEEFDMEKTH
ncbi:MAG: hypothetical protein AAF789_03575 [Bacteroidota bacterium]